VIPNERLMGNGPNAVPSFFDAFRIADDILRQAVQAFRTSYRARHHQSRLCRRESVMSGQGYAVMGTAVATGSNAAVDAANRAIRHSPLLEDNSIQGAQEFSSTFAQPEPFAARSSRSVVHHSKSRGRKRQHYFRRGAGRNHEGCGENHRYRRGLQGSQQEEYNAASAVHAAYVESGPRKKGTELQH